VGPRALAWLKNHWRPVAFAAALLVAFVAGRVSRPPPRIEAHEKESVAATSAEQHQEQVATTAQQATTAATTKHRDEQVHAHVHQVERITARGDRVVTTDTTFDDQVHVEEATHVEVAVNFTSLAQLSAASSSSSTSTRETSITQTPSAPPSWRVGAIAGLSTHGPVYGAEGAHRVFGPAWVGAGVLVPSGQAPIVVASVSFEW
jgi:hypothetical protein